MNMHGYSKLALGALLPVVVLAGCNDWLKTENAVNNPNFPTVASTNQLITAIEVGQTTLLTGDLDRLFMIWMQQAGGSDRQYVPFANYVFDEDAFSLDWTQAYTGGGLIDLRTAERQALTQGDSITAGIAYVIEALDIGATTTTWGDIPYSQAASDVVSPALDPQQQVYAEIQAKLDTALVLLQCTNVLCVGPGGTDIWANGDPTVWTPVAHTLKARYYLHTVLRDPTAAALAATEAALGIPDPAHNLETFQSINPNERNLFYQFMVLQRSGYMSAGGFLVNLLVSTHDPRLTKLFTKNSAGVFAGVPPGGGPGDYSTFAGLNTTDTTLAGAPNQRVPLVTFAENQLILAEANIRAGNPGGATTAYNAERTSQGVPTASGTVTLAQVITEKYIANFFNGFETWEDWKRTCLPALTPAPNTAGIPGRLLYPLSTERNANRNIPPPSAQPPRNWDTPNACPGNIG
jgi:hypothetical protein